MLSPRDHVTCALNHEVPDRVPIFFGTSGATTILTSAYEQLKDYLGTRKETGVLSRGMQYARINEEVLVRFGSDGRLLVPRSTPAPLRQELSANAFVDEWGATWQMNPHTPYYQFANPPLRNATVDDIDHYPCAIFEEAPVAGQYPLSL